MRKMQIKQKSGKIRTVYVPARRLRKRLKRLAPMLEREARRICPPTVIHGFTRGKSPVTNAMAHVGYAYTLSMDLKDFFDHVQEKHLTGILAKETIDEVLLDPGDGKPRALQGLPTSPAVANIAMSVMDRQLLQAFEKLNVVYTRYADDLTFSFNDPSLHVAILGKVRELANYYGFEIAEKKTHLMSAKFGRRRITGVSVDETGIYPPRATRRRLRAARHRAQTTGFKRARNRARGLDEWCKLRQPMRTRVDRIVVAVRETLGASTAG